MRRIVIGLLGAFVLVAASLGGALAKEGEIVVTLDPTTPRAGQPGDVGVTITRPDGTLIPGETVNFVLALAGRSSVVTATATEVTRGHYVASVTLPLDGHWVVGVTARDAGGMEQRVGAGQILALPAAAAGAAATTPAAATGPMVPLWSAALAVMLGAALALGGVWGAGLVRRRRLQTAEHRGRVVLTT